MNYFVWLRGLRGPEPQLHLNNPRQSIHWPEMESRVIGIVALKDHERGYTLAQAVAVYPCPEAV
jgi:hypothetical protein